jgi:peptidoglycan hydrolase-like protein with peptidoglycan-binding domain
MLSLYRHLISQAYFSKVVWLTLFVALSYIAGLLQVLGGQMSATQQSAEAQLEREHAFEAERLLHKLGYWPGRIDGVIDEKSRHAIIAFQKVEGRNPEGVFTLKELRALRRASRPSARFKSGPHIEVDLARQVLLVVGHRGTVKLVLPVSTGSGITFTEGGWTRRAITPRGKFTVYKKMEGWKESSLGSLYYPNYFVGGVAIHGSRIVPTFPSTHGCVGIPLYTARDFSRMTPPGTVIIVYGQPPTEENNSRPNTVVSDVINEVPGDQLQP